MHASKRQVFACATAIEARLAPQLLCAFARQRSRESARGARSIECDAGIDRLIEDKGSTIVLPVQVSSFQLSAAQTDAQNLIQSEGRRRPKRRKRAAKTNTSMSTATVMMMMMMLMMTAT